MKIQEKLTLENNRNNEPSTHVAGQK